MKGLIRLGNLHGPEGNAFVIMGNVQRQGRQQGMDQAEIDAILTEMRSGDYEHLLDTVLANFNDLDNSIETLRENHDKY